VFPRLFALILAGSLVLAAPEAHAQRREVQGTVTNAQGAPLAGANVFLAGSSTGAVTDPAGAFRLSVPAGDVRIRVTMIGYRGRDLAVPATQNTLNVQLEPDVLNLEGLVVTGQATTVARRNLANAVATVGAQELERAPAPSVDKALQGKIAGANIQTNSGAPGGGVQVNLRGVTSINGASEPLWVVDGMVISNVAISSGANAVTAAAAGSNASNQDGPVNRIADINPRDIERIEVLKGASAAAIYGSQASNGVILITTKRGQSGAPRVGLTQRMGVSALSKTIGMRSWTRDKAVDAFPGLTSAQLDEYFAADGTPRQSIDLERQLAGRTPLSSETSFSVSGGLSDTRYFVSGLWLKDEGIIENTGFDKHSLRLNLNHRLGARVDVDVHANVLHSLARRGLTNNDNAGASYYVALASTPNFVDLRRQPDGTFPLNPIITSNPLQTAALLDNDESVWRGISGASLNATFFENDQQKLQLRFNGGADYFLQRNDLFSPPDLQFEPDDKLPGTSVLGNNSNLVLNGTANLIHSFTPSSGWMTATTSAGVQYLDNDLLLSSIIGRNLVGGKRNRDAATTKEVFETRRRTRTLGLYAQEEMLLLNERMLLTASLRADRSSANGDTEKYFYYPKFAASYRFNDLLPGLDELKLRSAFGASGNQPLFGQKFTPLDPTSNIQGLPALVVQGVAGDPDIRPEHTRELEGGLDATLLGGRGHLEFTLFRKNITDLLLQRTVAQSTGYTAQFFNGGELQTKGLEIALDATPLQRGSVSWVSRVTYSANRSKIIDLPVPSFRTGGFGTSLGSFEIEAGKSATQIVGFDQKDGKTIVRKMGDANPDFRVGFSNELGFGRFHLSSLLDWQKGGALINLTKLLYDLGANSPDFDLPAGVSAPRPIPECNPKCSGIERLNGFGKYTQQYVEDASFVKLREISLTYDVPSRWLGSRTGAIKSAQISLSGRNLLTFSDYWGVDPEVSNFGNQSIARNIDVAPYPPSRSFWLSLDLGL
jgi:TonB-linked SusC/RagA family outer membrane protein